ncbi:pentatricopeptide repeat-containing protein [Populus alba x Populus x berolinensis]|uniref:Pentatricopeptide repeat-containing protein n=1 Tax=Populus alba x Populus x berolinensis TaxID=444605 RepID=A0AAD6PSV1_9ROSI|nr:pentatricopeptide repeat-containing protein [Populus alba x Populus x berolinensis]
MLKAQRKVYVPFRHAQFLLRPNAVSPSSPLDLIKLLKLSADTKTVKVGKTIHSHLIVTSQATENNIIEVNSLINFYAKVNQVSIAHNLFDRMPDRNVVSWSALMTGYLLNGFSLKVIRLLKDMISEGNVSPNEYIFAIAISSCCDRGRVEEGRQCHGLLLKTGFSFHNYVRNALVSMYSKCSIVQDAMGVWNEVPVNDIVAYNSILSRLVENGYLREGLEVLRSMVSESVKWDKNYGLGRWVAEFVLEMDPNDVGTYTLLSNIYAKEKRWDGVVKVRKLMRDKKIKKEPGVSWIEIGNVTHIFTSEDNKHPDYGQTYQKVKELLAMIKPLGYTPDIGAVLHDVEDEQKEYYLSYHSEKLAIAYGLLKLPSEASILVIKNLRICDDCHSAVRLISKPPWWLQDIEHVRSPTRAIMGHGNHALL